MLLLGLVNSSAVTNDRLTMLNSTLILILVRSNCWKMWQIERIFLKLNFPEEFINFIITRFIESRNQQQVRDVQGNASVRIILPFKDQIEPTSYETAVRLVGKKKKAISASSQARKLSTTSKQQTSNHALLINQQRVVYKLKWSVLCGLRWLYSPTSFRTPWWTQTLSYWKTPAWRPQMNKELQEQFITTILI